MRAATTSASPRERVLRTAYELFSHHGVATIGVDRIVAEAGVAKMTLYRHFRSKDELVLAFLQERERRWTNEWLRAEAGRRGATAAERMLAIFEVFGEWFAREDFEGCSFINVMLEVDDVQNPVRQATVRHLEAIRGFVSGLAEEAGIQDPDGFARQWHILMKGSIVSAAEGDLEAASRAKQMGGLLLAHHGVKAHRVSPTAATVPAPPSTGRTAAP